MSGLEVDIESALSGVVEVHLKGGGAVFVGEVLQNGRFVSLIDAKQRPVVIDLDEIAAVRVLTPQKKKEN